MKTKLDKKQAQKRIAQLKKVINYHNYFYHVLDKPQISDAAFDSLKHELYQLEKKYPELITADSPTQRVSGQALAQFKKVRHRIPMLSLEDVFTQEEFKAWQERIQKMVPNQKLDYFVELKIDGLAITLIYQKGLLVRGATRGNGWIGEEVTQNLKTIPSIPLKLELRKKLPPVIERRVKRVLEKGQLEVRGEVYMTKQAFERINQERQKKGLPLYANPRNTAAGSIRQLDPRVTASRQLSFLAYDLVTDLGQKTHQLEHQIIEALGFKTDQGKHCSQLSQAIAFWQRIKARRQRLPYQIDGLVVQVNNNQVFRRLGVAGKAPRGAIAFKFPAKEATTVVEDIVVQVGRTGALTPVALLRPVRLGGTLISRATLHNADEVKRLDVRIGDTVIVQRAGDVIPDIVQVLKKMRTGQEKKFQMPQRCPVCGSRVVRSGGEVVYRCRNPHCSALQHQRLYHFVSKKALDIRGLGPKIIDQLISQGLISQPSDIFSLTKGDLLSLEGFAQKSAENLIESINQSKEIPLARFIFALGIRHVGEETAIDLANHFGSLKNLAQASQEELTKIKDIGPVAAQSIFQWFKKKKNQKLLDDLLKKGLLVKPVKKRFEQKLKGLTFVLTGQLKSLTRDEAKERIRKQGGKVAGSVSRQTDYLVLGQKPGSKYNQAKKMGLKIIKEKQFLKLIK